MTSINIKIIIVVVKIYGSRLGLVNFFYARKASDGGMGDTGFDWFGQRRPYVQYQGCSCYPRGVL